MNRMKLNIKWLSMMMALCMVVLAACSGNGDEKASSQPPASSSPEASETGGAKAEPKTLKVNFFQGGYGDAWFIELKKQFESIHENVTVELEGDPGIAEKIGPRMETGNNVPDVVFMPWDWQQGASQGLLADLSDLYNGESADGGSFKDSMNNAAQQAALYQGTPYVIPWSDGVLSMAYNAGMLEENGWEVPDTWAEFAELAEKIKAKGIAPIVYPGLVIGYWDFVVSPLVIQAGGLGYVDELQKLESPEVLNNPAKLQALEQFERIMKSDWLLKGSEAMNHTEAQMQFVNGKAAFIPNGNWLENEMKSATPEGFKMKMMKVPALDNAKDKDIYYSLVGPEVSFVPAKAKEIELGKEFIKFAASREMNRKFTELTGSFRPFNYDLEGIQVSEFTKSVNEIMQNNKAFAFTSKSPMYIKFGGIYPSGDPYGAISTGQLTAQQQFDNDYKFAKEKWDAYKKELGIE